MGKLQGIKLNTDLRSVIDKVLLLPQPASNKATINDNDNGIQCNDAADAENKSLIAASTPEASLARARKARRAVASAPSSLPWSPKEAHDKLTNIIEASRELDNNDEEKSSSSSLYLPLSELRALAFLIENSTCENYKKEEFKIELESSLRKTSFSFSRRNAIKNNTNTTTKHLNDDKTTDDGHLTPFQKRMQHLRLLDEENSYRRLTTNLKDIRSLKDDNVTAKSMMYATSVGLNMIVAPVSFGVFMYFFSGSLFSRFFDEGGDVDGSRGGVGNAGTDIRRVIAGVVCGVFMLFVEMILFVIRSHELDASVRKKEKRKENRANPFGYTERTAKRVYDRDD